jgi:hypothetical protein
MGRLFRLGYLLELIGRIPQYAINHAAARVIPNGVAVVGQPEHAFRQFQGFFQALVRRLGHATHLLGMALQVITKICAKPAN